MEKIDVYNCNREKTGKIFTRYVDEHIEKDEYLISVTCWIVNKYGEILLTQRRLDKSHGGMWEPTTGTVISGENSLEGIQRELSEEIGLKVDKSELKLVKTIVDKKPNLNFFRDIYILRKDISLSELKFLDGEVIDAEYVTMEEFKNMINNGEVKKKLEYFIDLVYNLD